MTDNLLPDVDLGLFLRKNICFLITGVFIPNLGVQVIIKMEQRLYTKADTTANED